MLQVLLKSVAVLCTAILLTGCMAEKPYKETQFLMDTVVEMTVYGPQGQAAVKEAFAEFQHIHQLTNVFAPESQVSEINRQAGISPVAVDPLLFAMIEEACQVSAQVEGAFDITVGPLSDLWGIGKKGDYVPSKEELAMVMPLVDYRQVLLDKQQQTVYLAKAGMKLDLGGIAKGYAVDRAIEMLKAKGVQSALINAGGDVRVIGTKPDKTPWRIGVQHPRKEDGMIAKLALEGWDTMETSGDYQRYMEKSGMRYSHILDPRSGYQPQEVTSVTIVNNNSAMGDFLSTALFVLGVDKGKEVLKKFPGNEAIIITKDQTVIVTEGLQGSLELVEAN